MQTRYAKVGSAHVAYRVLGEGPLDLLLFMGEYIPVDALDEEPRLARAMRRLASLGRVIAFNRRGVGLSDAPGGPLTQHQVVEDAVAVIDATGATKVIAIGWNVGGPAAIRFAADHEDRTLALVLLNTYARLVSGPDYPIGIEVDRFERTAQQTTSTEEVDFDFLTAFAPSVAGDDRFRTWWEQAGNRAASPSRSAELWALLGRTDERDALPAVTAPTLIVTRPDVMQSSDNSRYMTERIPNARLVELPGRDLIWWVGDVDPILDEIELFVTDAAGSASRPRRSLATVLFLDVVRSTQAAARLGDRRWRDLLGTYHELAGREVDRLGGQRISTSGDGVLATFGMPADAVRSAMRIADGVRALDIELRAGVHTGEIEIVGDDVAGIGVHIAARVMAAAGAGEILVSRTVCDLVTGSGLSFTERGEHELKDVPGRWALFAVNA